MKSNQSIILAIISLSIIFSSLTIFSSPKEVQININSDIYNLEEVPDIRPSKKDFELKALNFMNPIHTSSGIVQAKLHRADEYH